LAGSVLQTTPFTLEIAVGVPNVSN
jgi:hypothetical protein